MIEVDTKQYLPLHIAEIDEFKNITKTYDKYLSLVWDSLQREELNRVLATMDTEKQSVDCGVKIVSIQMIGVIFDLIRKRVPANMLVSVYAIFNRWERFKTLRWQALKTETWKSLFGDKKWQEG